MKGEPGRTVPPKHGRLPAGAAWTSRSLPTAPTHRSQGTGADGLTLALALLWERRDECPGATPVLVCHDEVVVECDAEQAPGVKAWLEKAMIEGMEAGLNDTDEVDVPVEVEARIVKNWGERS